MLVLSVKLTAFAVGGLKILASTVCQNIQCLLECARDLNMSDSHRFMVQKSFLVNVK